MHHLFIPDFHRRRLRYRTELGFRLTWYCLVFLLLSQCFVIPVWSYYSITRREARQRAGQAAELARAAADGLARHAALLGRAGLVQAHDGALRDRQPVVPLLSVVERSIPEGLGLRGITLVRMTEEAGKESPPGGVARRSRVRHELVLEGQMGPGQGEPEILRWRDVLERGLPARVVAVRGGALSGAGGAGRFELRLILEPR